MKLGRVRWGEVTQPDPVEDLFTVCPGITTPHIYVYIFYDDIAQNRMFFTSVQRKEYSETLSKNPDSINVRVEVNEYKLYIIMDTYTLLTAQHLALIITDPPNWTHSIFSPVRLMARRWRPWTTAWLSSRTWMPKVVCGIRRWSWRFRDHIFCSMTLRPK